MLIRLTESSSVASFEERASLVEQQAKIGQLASKFGQHIACELYFFAIHMGFKLFLNEV